MKNKKGFTLIELLVVIAIIGLLSTLAIVSLNTARQRSRDAKRTADIRTLQSAVELCINEGGNAPARTATWAGLLASTCGTTTFGSFLASSVMPTPPQTGCAIADSTGDCYMYCQDSVNTDTYLLYSQLESAPSGGVTGNLATYVAGECVLSAGAPTAIPTACAATDPGDFCLGTL